MTPRATRPALASPCAIGVSPARLDILLVRDIVPARMEVAATRRCPAKSRGRMWTAAQSAFALRACGNLRVLAVVIAK